MVALSNCLKILIHFMAFILILVPSIGTLQVETRFMDSNRSRYSRRGQSSLGSVSLESILELSAPTSRLNWRKKQNDPRSITRGEQLGTGSELKNTFSEPTGETLDAEDERLLDKFYKTSEQYELVGNEIGDSKNEPKQNINQCDPIIKPCKKDNILPSGWTLGTDIVKQNSHTIMGEEVHPNHRKATSDTEAGYSPSLRLLTSYVPIENGIDDAAKGRTLILGSTIHGKGDVRSEPSINSNQAVEAIIIHNDLMKKPPSDGKVRVRMYYHQAIHDDQKLYGTGPWKYWGHGWGLEFGYDPRSESSNRDSYQRGYTLERAFGRDFCRDPRRCRKPDPEFFKDPRDAGKYTIQVQGRDPKILPKISLPKIPDNIL